MNEAWKTFYKPYGQESEKEFIDNKFGKNAKIYEESLVLLGYQVYKVVVPFLKDYMNKEIFESSSCQILDIGAGTGLVGFELQAANFKGNIDGIDGSQEMLQEAAAKNVYRNLTQKIILPDTKLEIKDETYDAISCIGSFSPGQIRPIVLKELIRITKCGGLIILTSRDQKESNSFISELRSVMQSLEKAGQMKILKFNRELQGYKDLSESSEPPLYCCAYCLQVL